MSDNKVVPIEAWKQKNVTFIKDEDYARWELMGMIIHPMAILDDVQFFATGGAWELKDPRQHYHNKIVKFAMMAKRLLADLSFDLGDLRMGLSFRKDLNDDRFAHMGVGIQASPLNEYPNGDDGGFVPAGVVHISFEYFDGKGMEFFGRKIPDDLEIEWDENIKYPKDPLNKFYANLVDYLNTYYGDVYHGVSDGVATILASEGNDKGYGVGLQILFLGNTKLVQRK